MIRRTLLVSAFTLVAAAGCRKAHLGADHGVAYREALAAQRDSDPARTPTFTAEDAKATAAARRGAGDDPAGPASSSIVVPMPAPASSSGGAWPGASGNISLEAK